MFHSLPIFSHPPKQAHRRGPLRIASAERRVKPLARLLRCATALRVTAPLGWLRLRWLVWPKGSLRRVRRPPPICMIISFIMRKRPPLAPHGPTPLQALQREGPGEGGSEEEPAP